MSDTATFSYSQGDYTIAGKIYYDIPNVINLTAKNIKNKNIFIGYINNVNIDLQHKITCAFSYDSYTIIEDLYNNHINIIFNFYDDTTLVINLIKKDE